MSHHCIFVNDGTQLLVNDEPIHCHFFNDDGKEEKKCLIIAFRSLNSSELESEEFNDENTMMSH